MDLSKPVSLPSEGAQVDGAGVFAFKRLERAEALALVLAQRFEQSIHFIWDYAEMGMRTISWTGGLHRQSKKSSASPILEKMAFAF